MSAANFPRIGCHANLSFTTIQANISAAESFNPPPEDIQPTNDAIPLLLPRRNTRSQTARGDDDTIDAASKPINHACKCLPCFVKLIS